MKKDYQKPSAEYISLAAAEQIATGASYYADDDIGFRGDVGSNPFR